MPLKRWKYMIIKQKLYKIALVSLAIVLMLASTAGASRNGNLIFKSNPATNMVDFLKFPVAGFDDDYGYGNPIVINSCCDKDKSCSDKDKCCDNGKKCPECPKCPDCQKCPDCPSCSAPFLTVDIHKDKDPKGQTIYNYKVTNTGNAPLTGKAFFDNREYPGSLAPGESIQFQTLKPILHKAT
jgi:hypothetical protein